MKTFLPAPLKRTASHLVDLVLPPRCPMTGELVGQHGTLDPVYWGKLNFIQDPLCVTCGIPFPHETDPQMICGSCLQDPPIYNSARSVWRYDDASTGMVLKFKHADGTQLAPLLAGYMHQTGKEMLSKADILVPVPLHRWRLLKRRYNQAGLLAAILSRITKIPCAAHCLRRKRATESQGRKTREQRKENIAGAFLVPEKCHIQIKGKKIVLIDDVFTSGATVHECVKTLLGAGAASVDVLTLSKVVKS